MRYLLVGLSLLLAAPVMAATPSTGDRALRKECGTAEQCTARGLKYYNGDGVPSDFAKAAAFYRLGCDEGNLWGCYNLADLYLSGKGVAADPAKAAALHSKACDGNYALSCALLGSLYADGNG